MNAHTHSSQEFQLLVDDCFNAIEKTSEASSPSSRRRDPIVVPPGASHLAWRRDGTAELKPVDNASTVSTAALPMLERLDPPVGQPRLLLVAPAQHSARINGLTAPRVALLAEGDNFYFDDSIVFRVAIYHRPRLGPVPPELVGVACSICTIALAAGDHCLICGCGSPLHAAADPTNEQELDCARMASECNHCQRSLRLTPGYGERSSPAHD
jgi:hypothetical protein